MHNPDSLIASCKSWSDFCELTTSLSTHVKGRAFERLTQLYLQTAPEYQAQLKHVWLLRDVPPAVCRRLNLPALDEGIDLIACTRHGEYWAIQSKFRERDQPLTRRELGTFTSLAFNTCSNIALAVVVHTSSKPVSKRHLMRKTTEIGLDRWEGLDREAWGLIVAKLSGKALKPTPRQPLPHQAEAICKAEKHFVHDGAARGRLIPSPLVSTSQRISRGFHRLGLFLATQLMVLPAQAANAHRTEDWGLLRWWDLIFLGFFITAWLNTRKWKGEAEKDQGNSLLAQASRNILNDEKKTLFGVIFVWGATIVFRILAAD